MLKKIIATIIMICMACSMTVATVSAAPAEIKPIIIDFSTQETYAKSAESVMDDGDTLHMSFTKADGIDCARLEYGTYTGPYQGPKIASSNYYTAFKKAADEFTEKPNSSFVVIVYMTHDKEKNEIKLFSGNRNRSSVTLVEDASVSVGKMVRSEAINIAESHVYKERIMKGESVKLQYESFKENTDLYVKEIAFFESAEDANTYYGNKYTVAGKGTTAKSDFVKFDFSSFNAFRKSKLSAYIEPNDAYHGEFVSDGDGSLKLNYGEYAGTIQGAKLTLSNYYAYFTNQSEGFFRIEKDLKYMVIVFMTKDTNEAPILLWNTASREGVQLVDNASASKGKFVRSEAIDLTQCDLYSRISHETKVLPFAITYDSYVKNTELYIKEMVFFNSAEAADAYYEGKYEVAKNEEIAPPPPAPDPEPEPDVTEEVTTVATTTAAPATTAPAATTEEAKKSGCGSAIAPVSVAVFSLCTAGIALTKKRR